ncbi:hypothetical protein ACWDD9_11815 [Kitasatospora sp. NPDC001119]
MDPDTDAGIPVYETIDPERLAAIEASFAELGAHAHGRPLHPRDEPGRLNRAAGVVRSAS